MVENQSIQALMAARQKEIDYITVYSKILTHPYPFSQNSHTHAYIFSSQMEQ
jgi:hypothetical protein